MSDDISIWPLEESRQKLVLKNAHRLLRRHYKGVPLWSFISEMSGHGSGYSAEICKAIGWDAHQDGSKSL